jgi:hypothetical protein
VKKAQRSGSIAAAAVLTACAGAPELPLLQLWESDQVAFGIYAPNEQPLTREERRAGERRAPVYTVEGGRALAENALLDYVFLDLEGAYDGDAVRALAEGLASETATSQKALLVRIPPIERAGVEATRARVIEIMAAGADGVVFPHVTSPEQASLAAAMVAETGASVWSPTNPNGNKIAMIMIEDPDALGRVTEFADVPGISILACGIGSLTQAMGGDREAAEAGNLRVLAESNRVGLANMITANPRNLDQRLEEGFPALLMSGSTADDLIRTGRTAAGRSTTEPTN